MRVLRIDMDALACLVSLFNVADAPARSMRPAADAGHWMAV